VIRYLADTNILGYFTRRTHAPLHARMQLALAGKEIAISVIARAETRFGLALLNANDKRRASIGLLLEELPALPWTADAANIYGDIAARLQQTGQPIGQMDTMIAAHALAEDLILVSHNTRHFEKVPGLKLEDWTVLI
jgi:tRNA(fMet)-specific endonuclease VapC